MRRSWKLFDDPKQIGRRSRRRLRWTNFRWVMTRLKFQSSQRPVWRCSFPRLSPNLCSNSPVSSRECFRRHFHDCFGWASGWRSSTALNSLPIPSSPSCPGCLRSQPWWTSTCRSRKVCSSPSSKPRACDAQIRPARCCTRFPCTCPSTHWRCRGTERTMSRGI